MDGCTTLRKAIDVKLTRNKFGATLALITLFGLGATGCSAAEESATPQGGGTQPSATETEAPVEEVKPDSISLEGSWTQLNRNSEDMWQEAVITGNEIEVYWVSEGGERKSLYWAGSVEVPADVESFTFDSVNDTSKTQSALLASDAETKAFTYENDELSYEVSALGETMTVHLGRE